MDEVDLIFLYQDMMGPEPSLDGCICSVSRSVSRVHNHLAMLQYMMNPLVASSYVCSTLIHALKASEET